MVGLGLRKNQLEILTGVESVGLGFAHSMQFANPRDCDLWEAAGDETAAVLSASDGRKSVTRAAV